MRISCRSRQQQGTCQEGIPIPDGGLNLMVARAREVERGYFFIFPLDPLVGKAGIPRKGM